MNILRRLMPALCLLLCVLPTAHAAAYKMPPGSYLTRPVSSVEDLCSLIRTDPKVAIRFTRHYRMTTSELVTYFKENTKFATLPITGRHIEYFIDVHGRMASHIKLVNGGVPVLVTLDDTPIMDLRCGNPMSKNLPKPMAKAKPTIKVAPAQQETPQPPAVVAPPPPPVVAQVPPAPTVQPEPVTQVLAQKPQEITFSPANIGKGVIALLPLLGAGAVKGHDHAPTPVPEPSSMVVLLSGASGLLVFRRRSR